MALVKTLLNDFNKPGYQKNSRHIILNYFNNNPVFNDYFAARKLRNELISLKNTLEQVRFVSDTSDNKKALISYFDKYVKHITSSYKNSYFKGQPEQKSFYNMIYNSRLDEKTIKTLKNFCIVTVKNLIKIKEPGAEKYMEDVMDIYSNKDMRFPIEDYMTNWRIIRYNTLLGVEDCMICYSPFRPDQDIVSHKNQHFFHLKCINRWYWEQRKEKCPIDRERNFGLLNYKKTKKTKKNSKRKIKN